MTDEAAFKEIQQLILDAGAEKHSLMLENQMLKSQLDEANRRADYFKKMALEKPFQLIKGGKKAK